ncbi:transglycosylase domain-containing protein [Virgibacillus sp. M23]|uniref:transglycosylase domain-containing protein n=1 Tax=Virgibacillus sp. M23 TaxID=3079030 RepID=UPI002A90A520|nr:transglycosylase domain-containing protein [Virgibacillus sp. M23]MDY7046651.1 transglycosylase domain-containing protein [Virgibacillus sp. M23]
MAKKRKIRIHKLFLISIGSLFLTGISLFIFVYLLSFVLGPPELANDQNTILYSNSGEIIGEQHGGENREWVNLKDMSEAVIQATVAIEDRNFYEHHGFDIKRIFGALLKDIQTWSLKEGASTLTQQYARNLYLSHEKTWLRKMKEAFYTVRLEMFYSKDKILEGYLNTIYYGHGAYGIESASNLFFDTSSKQLTLAQASMLAGIPKGPTYYSPLNDSKRAEDRQKQILQAMYQQGKITEMEYKQAAQAKLVYKKSNAQEKERVGPYFQDFVIKEAADLLNMEVEGIRSGGYQIHTTLQKDHQLLLEEQINHAITPTSEVQAGALAMNPNTGGIIAMVGGRNYQESSFNRTVQAKRQPGSSFKPFLYYAALENGYKPNTMLPSKPTTFQLANGETYQPSNYNGYYANKEITLAQALALSDNIYAVKTNLFVGPKTLVETAREFGITSKLPEVPSLALGSAAVSMKEMVTGYSMLANGGYKIDAHSISKIIDHNGKTVYKHKSEKKNQILDQRKTFILTHLMTGMFDHELDGYMPVTGSTITDQLNRHYAGKSGSTNSDSWMIGFSPSIATGIWIGYDDNRKIEKVAEERYAKEIWADFMQKSHENLPNETFSVPSGVIGVPVDPTTGKRATPYCNTSRVMFFEKGTEPHEYCTEHFHHNQEDKDVKREDKSIVEKIFDLFD